jgi:hypothetical protein
LVASTRKTPRNPLGVLVLEEFGGTSRWNGGR